MSGSTPKTSTERAKDRKRRMAEQGLKEIRNLWAHPDDEEPIRQHVAKLTKRRSKSVPLSTVSALQKVGSEPK